MIKGIGTDIVEIEAIAKSIENSIRFKERVFTKTEIDFCEQKPLRYQHYAARFAAKEAVMKALGTGWANGIQWKHIEAINEENGKPFIRLTGKAKEQSKKMKIRGIHISLSHSEEYAVAVVVLE
jgi:holo-[acyl-carrier protein] synthase